MIQIEKAPYRFDPLGEQAVLVSFESVADERAERRVVRLGRRLSASPFPGFREVVPSYTTLCVYFDALLASSRASGPVFETVCRWIEERWPFEEDEDSGESTAKSVEIPVCYCEACGPDLAEVAAAAGLRRSEAVALHASAHHRVSMIGFMPGFPYMSGLPSPLNVSRLKSPRKAVPAGSVAIAGGRTGIYPAESPGGWRVVGRTSAALFRADRTPPSLLDAGDAVIFVPSEHGRIEEELRYVAQGH